MQTPSLKEISSELSTYGASSASFGNFTVKIDYLEDGSLFDPRESCNNSVFAFEHRRYVLGDRSGTERLHETLSECLDSHAITLHHEHCNESQVFQISKMMELLPRDLEHQLITVPVYLYDHGGITISAAPHSCGWDSGCLGWAFTTPEMLAEMGHSFADFSNEQDREQVKAWILAEIETYDHYLTGQVFEFSICNDNGDYLSSSMGYLGDHNESGLFSELHESLSNLIETEHRKLTQQRASHIHKIKALIKNRVPLLRRCASVQTNPFDIA
ncbi:hypothetical protein VIBNISOn1_1050045 [Vibrio nigripulchritudo SOn1]|uniref:Uncharacterized protein n=1 Tax=Vibrio nigripulchritudo SOn1 TaxID=1238450 RepID=A0AAV2VHP4_9VIBR|nr:hypothetical protein [Vibrio nigripulchritudo]CCO44219.1 hypothetical protein VIBNISOn1_1050045 [Vibrio nigripulchritudo SOn1]